MRSIEIDTDVFALIWASRLPDENDESEILLRILNNYNAVKAGGVENSGNEISGYPSKYDSRLMDNSSRVQKEVDNSKVTPSEAIVHVESATGKIRWVDDVRNALRNLGGSASLHEIYEEVECLRRNGNRSVPKTLDAVVRRTIEEHSTDSKNFDRNLSSPDLFTKIGRGEWAIRNWAVPAVKYNALPFKETNSETHNRSIQMIKDSELKTLPTEREIILKLEDYLIKMGRPIRPPEAYRELARRFELTNEQSNRLMSNGKDVHWENRVRFARRKLKDSGKLDPDQPLGWWAIRPA